MGMSRERAMWSLFEPIHAVVYFAPDAREALVAAGLGPLEILALRCGMDIDREMMQPARGWTDEEWSAGQARAAARGLVDGAGRATPDGRDLFQALEDATDRAAAAPWDA